MQCDIGKIPAIHLNDVFTDLGKKLGITEAVEQAGQTTEAIEKASASADEINKTVNQLVVEAKTAWDIAKPVLIFFGVELAVLMTLQNIKNYQAIKK